jgi:hypothetical protein
MNTCWTCVRTGILPGLVILALACSEAASAQTPGYAEITSPASGEVISGVVTISGTADHPWFVGYDLSFAYDPNPTDTWFPVGEPLHSPVSDGRLALWDTTSISDGEYQLRLRVWLQDGSAMLAQVTALRVRNRTPVETATTGPAAAPAGTPTPVPPTATPNPTPTVSQIGRAGGQVSSAFASGVMTAVALLGSLGVYSFMRTVIRPRWASFQARRIYREAHRSRHVERPKR